jgi:hypothetical protein
MIESQAARTLTHGMEVRMRSVLLAIVVCLPLPAVAQAIRIITLATPNGRLDHEFTRVESIRELKDGRVIVSDPGDRGLVVVDFRNGSVADVSHKGRGPAEYAQAGTVYGLAADSSLMSDGGNRRWLLFAGDRVAVTIPPGDRAMLATQGGVSGVDTLGRLLAQRRPLPQPGLSIVGKDDSTMLILVSRARGTADTIAAVRRQPGRMEAQYGGDGKLASTRLRINPFVAGEKFILFRDGWLAVARVEPYRIDWRARDGRWTRGSALPIPLVNMSEREKRAAMVRMAKENNLPVSSPDTFSDWPVTLPPFNPSGPLLESSDGRLLVRHQPSADHEETIYDVVNRRGQLDGQLKLAPNEHVVGFGVASVYVVVADDDGIERLRRHPWTARQ